MNTIGLAAILPAVVLFATELTAQTVLKPFARDDLCVTNGAVASLPIGHMRIDTASSRAVVLASKGAARKLEVCRWEMARSARGFAQ